MIFPIRRLWGAVHSSLWFVPAVMVGGAIVLAAVMVQLDERLDLELARAYPRLFGANAEAARGILAAIAGSMITVAGVTFSVTIVALSLASNQYTSRILRNYMSDRGNQVVLGMFVSVFVYCVLVLRTVRGGEEAFVPSYALSMGILLGLCAIGFLIYFVHHVATSIQVSTILANVHRETTRAIEEMARRSTRHEPMPDDTPRPAPDAAWTQIRSPATGYLQDVDETALLRWADEHDAVLEMTCAVGDFVMQERPLLRIHGVGNLATEDVQRLCSCHGISTTRTIDQDPAYGLRQIVDIALKALSPGINDSTTAVSCVDYLGALVCHLMRLDLPSDLTGSRGRLRLISRRARMDFFIDLAFGEIRQHARDNPAIYLALLQTLMHLAAAPGAQRHHALLARQVRLVAQSATQHVRCDGDRHTFNARLQQVEQVLDQGAGRAAS